MAQPIQCDAQGEPHLADLIVTRIATGETLAWCDPDYVVVCRAIAEAVDEAERDQAAAEAATRLGAVTAPSVPPTSGESSSAGDPPAEPPMSDGDGPVRPETARRTRKHGAARPEPIPAASGDPDGAAGPE